ncbi:MAG: exodeoxyribonuclease VII large subunit [Candidatus Melainabacteria bacterium HGW-Melainabacteria-1]|nr:MAG: exodeoxyribonuclease VII large subunit [Candidatus Melainabacteria bacterium HGW-Melainabacteria-1]
MRPLTVTDITRAIKTALETCFPYPVEVEGEICNFRPHYSGHAYFTLKDSYSEISAVMWKSRVQQLEQALANGQQVICSGQVSVYEKTGRYQLNVLKARAVGRGDLQQRFELLKAKLWELGYFDEARKRPLPTYPRRVALITSPTGAAVRDLISVAMRRNPAIKLVLRPAQVQGARAAPDLVQALRDVNNYGDVDVIIIGRGGGSLEDLWAFNEEALAREIYNSRIPVVSAVGHEIDITLADLVADRRAPTPSAAAELVVPRASEMLGQLHYYQERAVDLIQARIRRGRQQVAAYQQHHALRRPQYQLNEQRAEVTQWLRRRNQAMMGLIARRHSQLEMLNQRLDALNPASVLARGYVQIEQDGQTIGHAAALKSGLARVVFGDGYKDISLEIINE